ncbi:MAG: primosomal protein N' (replication factor Y) - superfamily II helicase [Pseudomonadota bacterium]
MSQTADTPFGLSQAVSAGNRFPCENCGSSLAFSPGEDSLKCPSCGHVNPIPTSDVAVEEQDYQRALRQLESAAVTETTQAVKCDACAAEFTLPEGVHAQDCPFCGTPIVTETGPNKHIKPHAVAPFVVTDKQAHDSFNGWLGGLWFAPGDLKAYARQDERLRGVYVPYWTFDCDTHSRYQGSRGTAHKVRRPTTVMRNGKRVRVMRTEVRMRWRPVAGQVRRFFDDVLVLASYSIPPRMTEGLLPWRLEQLVPYQEAYLSGFISEAYGTHLDAAFADACGVMNRTIRRDVARDIGGDAQRISRIRTQRSNISFKHVLLPIWMATYRYGGKPYRFIINGQTGKVYGERPYSIWKIAGAIVLALILLLILAVVFAAGQGIDLTNLSY